MSAFEEAIFRVYDRSMMGLVDDNEEHGSLNSKVCRWLEHLTLGLAMFYFLALFTLHMDLVGNPGCLQELLQQRMLAENRTVLFPNDAILQINVPPRFRYGGRLDDDGADSLDLGGNRRRKLQHVKSKRGNLDTAAFSWDGAPSFMSPEKLPALGAAVKTAGRAVEVGLSVSTAVRSGVSRLLGSASKDHESENAKAEEAISGTAPRTANATLANNTIPARYLATYDYEFATDLAVLSLNNELRAKHDFQLINISLDGSSCFGSNGLVRALVPLGGADNVVLNNIVSSVHRGGMMTTNAGDYYLWKYNDIVLYKHAGEWVTFKIGMALKIFFLFFIVSHTTALLVRVLISTGAIIMYAVLYCTGEGLVANRMRHLTLAYPWLGVPIEMYIARSESPVPFISAQIQRIVCYYMLYEALQFASSVWFYDNSQPGQKELWLFAAMMFWEYYVLLYVRSVESIILFPRALFAAFALYHVYLYSFPMGFHMLALMCLMSFVGYLMIFCLRHYESKAYNRGVVTGDQPRAFSNRVSWPQWSHSIAPDFTLFMPVQVRSTNIYDTASPPPEDAAPEVSPAAADGSVELQSTSLGARLRSLLSGTEGSRQYQRLEEGNE